jgi:anaerobic magnesium-protoporphyrin IX monomethyl ester cyclase
MFINAIDPDSEVEAHYAPLGLGYLVSSLRQEFGPDYIEFKIVDRQIEEHITAFKPHIVGITSVSQNYNKAVGYTAIAKKYSLPVVVGGIHISALPSTLTGDMDVGVIGEGEKTIIDLFRLFEREGGFDKKELAKVEGVVFRDGKNKIVVTEKRKPIEPLDRIPTPARDMFKIRQSTYMFTSRGCPYRCTFCASCRFWGRVRFFSAEYVVKEIKELINKYKVKKITFWDDLFVASRTRLEKLLVLMKAEGILGKVKFGCNLRSNLVTDELISLLKKMNMRSVGMGLESGSPGSLRYLKGDNISISDNINAVKTVGKFGMKLHTSFIIGSPQESRADILQTLAFIRENQIGSFNIYVLTPYPGTPVWEYARKRDLVSEDMNWEALNVNFGVGHANAIILSEKLTREEIYELFLLFADIKKKRKIKKALRNPKSLLKIFVKILSRQPLIER